MTPPDRRGPIAIGLELARTRPGRGARLRLEQGLHLGFFPLDDEAFLGEPRPDT
ncbi:hypothetical protein LT493_18475 [Streptomyces tricolor]|nr:hypothetical protein [Streptomyces tricolor]